ncbi:MULTISPECIES: site-specific DNA-methyltransferase [unclassified Bifidobacterium]|uniref:site-specific DNA-methyltransferase n=1 Tax=unclassified Bifidobacterium TaxID=2608897 RepID=UPI00112CB6A6|nr:MULTISPECIES: DNA methyltransferase [unclassified Bifidobacterium]TPF77656.1 hypothetical protein BW09_08650 [Bifidobacterium sp. UTCIF-1]TPF79507.1 hypothetical protein BW08_09475 [Bifidobacterium sp. UTCIF-24]TPF81790.1 hypothetical protein BW12_08065 [Bifidobacterium sp. UTCIF-3]TPF83343.1 hypothetical protein BW07_10750 [Bifidobacterium sp. UTCIF-36]TPF88292.1 hypothetical protein BW10_10005 [Bifidobacterium sp. UTBIF-56]
MEVPRIEPVTPDITQENIEKILELFPNVATEVRDPQTGEVKRAVDFDALRDQLGDVAEGMRERYQFTWPGKRAAKEEARQPIAKTLRPVKDRSKNWDDTKNLYIEGDNLDALKILRETYAGKIKMIYIDPPYNTGHDFIYRDNFRKNADDYAGDSGEYDEDGGRLVANPESNGRFHSDWCTMMYSRLLLARDLLTVDGIIFISIDANEEDNLEKIADEIFGRDNRIADVAVVNNFKGRSDDKYIATAHEGLLIYKKKSFESLGVPIPSEYIQEYKLNDDKGKYRLQGLRKRGAGSRREDRPNMFYPFYYSEIQKKLSLVFSDDSIEILPKLSDGSDGRWRWGKETAQQRLDELTVQLVSGRNEYDVFQKDYLSSSGQKRIKPKSVWIGAEYSAEAGTLQTKTLLGKNIFDTPKSVGLLLYCLEQATSEEDIILDFFSGSATTAHAVMQLNAGDGGNRKFIMVQLPEVCDENSEAAKAGYHTICEIGEERIRRAGEKIKAEIEQENQQLELGAEPKQVPDIGFRVLRVDSSNYADARRSPLETTQGELDDLVDVSKADRDSLDKLFECFPSLQLPYDSSIEVLEDPAFAGHTVYSVNGGQLVACFDAEIPESVLRGMAALDPKPSYAVVAEAGLKNSQTVTNFTEIFKQAANARQGSTQIRII